MKPESCKLCPLYGSPGPISNVFTGDFVDVLFIGEAPGAVEIQQGLPMVGEAGQVLRRTIREINYTSYGIDNVWLCRPPANILPEEGEPGEYCKQHLQEVLVRCQRVIVPLGSTALKAVTNLDAGITQLQGRIFSSNGHVLLPMYHPSYMRRNGYFWRDWELSHTKLRAYLDGKSDYISPEERIVKQILTTQELVEFLPTLRSYTKLACDIETTAGYSPWAGAKTLSMSIAWDEKHGAAFMWDIVDDTCHKLLADLFSSTIKWNWYNGQYDTQFLRAEGFDVRIDQDAQLEVHVIDERGSSDETSKSGVIHSLKRDAGTFLDASNWEYDIKTYAPRKEDSYEVIPRDKLLQYNGFDSIHTLHLSQITHRYMEEEGTLDYYYHVVVPTFNMLSRSRYVGMRVDVRRTKSLQDEMKPVLEELTAQMVEVSGDYFFNPGSPAQVKKALWSRGLKVEDTRKETLAQYEGDELIDAIRDYRDCSKMLSTYVTGLVNDVYDDMRVHPDWRVPTETGRPRCSSPNLLGMPRKAEVEEHKWKRYIKEQFIADPGTEFLHLDRKQSEVRCMVFLADCLAFIEHLMQDPRADIHGEFTKMLYGTGYTKEQRVLVKMIVFGLIYNREAPSLAAQFTAIEREKAKKAGLSKYKIWSVREAQKFIDDFFKLFPEMLTYKTGVMRVATSSGILRGYMGRLRRFGLVNYDNKHHIENESVNFMPSNLSADLNFLSCVETMKVFGKYGVEVLVPIHDAGLLRIPKDSIYLKDEITALWESLVYKELTRPGLPLLNHEPRVPFPVDVTTGERWSDL